jgi:hypothetical protein
MELDADVERVRESDAWVARFSDQTRLKSNRRPQAPQSIYFTRRRFTRLIARHLTVSRSF